MVGLWQIGKESGYNEWTAAVVGVSGGANEGVVTFVLDEVQKANLPSADHDTEGIGPVWLGGILDNPIDSLGSYYFAAFRSHCMPVCSSAMQRRHLHSGRDSGRRKGKRATRLLAAADMIIRMMLSLGLCQYLYADPLFADHNLVVLHIQP